jgi:hypothetical protein
MGKSGKKPRESHRQGRGRRASHFCDEDGYDLPSSAYDATPRQNEESSEDNDDTSEATAEDEPERDTEAGEQDQWQGSMPSKFHLYQLSVQVPQIASSIVWICEKPLCSQHVRRYANACNILCLVAEGGHQLLAEVLPDVCRRARPSPPAGGFLWHGPPQVKHESLCMNVQSSFSLSPWMLHAVFYSPFSKKSFPDI